MVEVPQYQQRIGAARPDVTPLRAAKPTGLQRGLDQVGKDAHQIEMIHLDREATAQAKERDAMVADEIRALMYDPASGFMATRGGNAVGARSELQSRLDDLERRATNGLSPAAARKIESQIRRRIDGAMQSADSHTMAQRNAWLDGASEARLTSAVNDAMFAHGDFTSSFGVIQSEIEDLAGRHGWSPELKALKLTEAKSKAVLSSVATIANVDPSFAMEVLEKNKDHMTSAAYGKAYAELLPEVKSFEGRNLGRGAFALTGNMEGVLDIASDTLGMSEVQQREELTAWMRGENIDPATTPWCAAWVNATLAKAGMGGTRSNMALSFLAWGVGVDSPKRGDVVVLSRGSDPTKGHVGFFDGYDENGNIRLLGGNQSNAVTVQSYSPSRVLGFRRASGNGTGAGESENDVAAQISRLAQIEDPDVREAAINEFNLQVSAAQGVRDAALNENQELAFDMIEGGGSVEDLSVETRRVLGHERMAALRTFERQYKTSTATPPTVTDPVAYNEVYQLVLERPAVAAEQILTTYAGRLSLEDTKYFLKEINKPKDPVKAYSTSTLMSTASAYAKNAGLDKNERVMAQMQMSLVRWQDDFISENGRKPTIAEMNERASAETVKIVIDPAKGWNIKGYLGGIQLDGGTPDDLSDDIRPSDLVGTTFRGADGSKHKVTEEQLQAFAEAYMARYGHAPDVESALVFFATRASDGRLPSAGEISP